MAAKTYTYLIALMMLATTGFGAVTLAPTPVQDALRVGIARDQWKPTSGPFLFAERQLDEFSDGFGGSLDAPKSGQKSKLKAILYSALVPGGGQYYLGKRRTARFFFAAEAMTWVGYIAFHTYGNWRESDFINYASVHANARLEGKDEEFLAWVGFYQNIRDFNNLGRAFDPDRGFLADTPENHWAWQSDLEQRTYRDLRNRSKESFRRSEFMIGVAVVNRVISIIDAVRSTGRINRRIGGGDNFSRQDHRPFKLSVNPFSSRRQICFTFFPGL